MRRLLRILLLIILIAAVAAAVIILQQSKDDPTKVDGEDIINLSDPVPITGQILAWTANAIAPGTQDKEKPGRFIRINAQGNWVVLGDAPLGTSRVIPCSERAATANGLNFAFYAGDEGGSLFLYDAKGELQTVDEVGELTCLGMGTFQYAEDGTRFGYIDYSATAWMEDAPTGTLVIRQTAGREERGRFQNAIAFDLTADSLAYVGLFAENEQIAVYNQFSADGGAPGEIATLSADAGCKIRAGDLEIVNGDQLAVLLGQDCGDESRWSLYIIGISERSTTLIKSGIAGGDYFGSVRINTLFVAPDGDTVYFTVPNGLTKDRADLYAVSLTPGAEPERLLEYVLLPKFTPENPHDPARNAWPIVSPDRRWLVASSNDPNNEAAVNIVDISQSNPLVVSLKGVNRGDSVSAMGFSQDNQWLIVVMGGNNGADNTLWKVNMDTLIEETLTRANYATQLVVEPGGTAVALGQWELLEEPTSDRILNLVRVDLNTLETATLRTGGDITASRVANRRFVFPLQWR